MTTPSHTFLRIGLISAALCACFSARAADAIEDIEPIRPSPFSQETSFRYSFSPNAGVKHSGVNQGDVELQRYNFDYKLNYKVEQGFELYTGIHYTYMQLGPDSTVFLPGRLQSVGIVAGVTKDLSNLIGPNWGTLAFLRPTLTSDASNFSAPGFVLEGAWGMTYRQSEQITWVAGILFSTHAENYILPLAGVRWDFADDWRLTAGFPETAIAYKISEDLTVKGLATFMQGSYRTNTVQNVALNDTYLEFREIRLGAGADYKINDMFSVNLYGGAVVYRVFDYVDRSYTLKGNPGGYFSIGVQARF